MQAAKSVEAARKALETGAPGSTDRSVSYREVAIRMQIEYSHGQKDPAERSLDEILTLFELLRREQISVHQMLDKAAAIIRQQYRLRWVAVGLKNAADGLFRYEILSGFREDAIAARKKQAFRLEDFMTDGTYKGWSISSRSKMYFEEDKPYTDGSQVTFNRPILMNSSRRTPDESLEADYLDVQITGSKGELLGWIETSGTIAGKLPDVTMIKWIEMIACVLGVALMKRRHVVG